MLGYSETAEVFKAYYSRMSKVEEAIHEKFNENELDNKMLELDYAFFNLHISDKASNARNESKESEISRQEDKKFDEIRELSSSHYLITENHPMEKIIGDHKENVKTRSFYRQ